MTVFKTIFPFYNIIKYRCCRINLNLFKKFEMYTTELASYIAEFCELQYGAVVLKLYAAIDSQVCRVVFWYFGKYAGFLIRLNIM